MTDREQAAMKRTSLQVQMDRLAGRLEIPKENPLSDLVSLRNWKLFSMHIHDRMGYAEIASVTGMSAGRVRKICDRTGQMLYKRYAGLWIGKYPNPAIDLKPDWEN